MRKTIFKLIPFLSLLLTGCNISYGEFVSFNPSSSSSSSSAESSSSKSGSSKDSSSSSSKEESSSEDSSSEDSSGGSSSSSEEDNIKTIDIYTSNDFHGQIMSDSGRAGILEMGTFFKEKSEQENTLLIDQGDTWQGSIYSNYNHGELITDVMNCIQYDARCVGNHDFDWGTDYIEYNTAKSYKGYSTPVLAGNVYNYDFDNKIVGNVQQSNLGTTSVTYVLENGLKVGILGGIGRDQITSINSALTRDIAFTDHISFIKSEATKLRNYDKCDIIIASIHTGQGSLIGNELDNYIDLALCGHTHEQECYIEGDLCYVQNYSNGESFGHIQLSYDAEHKEVVDTTVNWISGATLNATVTSYDAEIYSIYDSYVSECETAANEKLATNVTNVFNAKSTAENLMAKAIFEQATNEGYDVCLSYVNDARHSLPIETWIYADLYESFPFDNVVYIADIKGSEFLYEICNYNYIYRNPTFTENAIDPNATYRIAILDYLYLHTNSNRYYNYFSETGGTSNITLSKNYREILRDYLKAHNYHLGAALDPDFFSSSSWYHNRHNFYSA